MATIYQELDLVSDLSVSANIFLGHERRLGPLLDQRAMRREAIALLARLGHPDLTEPVIPNLIVMQAQGVFKDNVDGYIQIGF